MDIARSRMPGKLFLSASLVLVASTAFADQTPQEWLSSMRAAVQSTSYEGTVIRMQDGNTEALRVVHTVTDGVIHEKVVSQEGNGLVILRSGNKVHRILPDRQSVLVEDWDNDSTLFSTLPSSDMRFGSAYDLALDRTERIAGRETIMLVIRPHDDFRYGHRIWLDTETSFPLQTQLVDGSKVLEELKFADISITQDIHPSSLTTSFATDQYSWFKQSSAPHGSDVETAWINDELPAGFAAVSTHEETMSSSDEMVTHILFSDGLANVSVFISSKSNNSVSGPARMAGTNSYCATIGDFEITAIGEVPAATVKQIAITMQQR
jgi:sigma-E factor negative regulatory protein RseB